MTEFDETKAMIILAHRLKANRLKYKTLEIEFSRQLDPGPQIQDKTQDSMPTEDELLYWSTDFTPNIRTETPME